MGVSNAQKRLMDYITLYNVMVVQPAFEQQAAEIAKQIRAEPRYKQVEKVTGVSADLVGVFHYMESGRNFKTHLHNGDSLRRRTVNVPAGRPKTGKPPFKWVDSAMDAVRYDKVTTSKDKAEQCEAAIRFNGLGYEKFGIVSPYGFSGSNLYQRGKYVKDGVYSATAVSNQVGACVILRQLESLDAPKQGKEPDYEPNIEPVKVVVKAFVQPNPKDRLSVYFTVGEFNKNGTRNFVSQKHLDACKRLAMALDDVREFYGKPIIITSGIRTPEANRAAGGATSSYHLTTRGLCAADIMVQGVPNRQVFDDYNGTWLGGLGRYSNGTTHLDLGESYTKDATGKEVITRSSRRWDHSNRSELHDHDDSIFGEIEVGAAIQFFNDLKIDP